MGITSTTGIHNPRKILVRMGCINSGRPKRLLWSIDNPAAVYSVIARIIRSLHSARFDENRKIAATSQQPKANINQFVHMVPIPARWASTAAANRAGKACQNGFPMPTAGAASGSKTLSSPPAATVSSSTTAGPRPITPKAHPIDPCQYLPPISPITSGRMESAAARAVHVASFLIMGSRNTFLQNTTTTKKHKSAPKMAV